MVRVGTVQYRWSVRTGDDGQGWEVEKRAIREN